MFDGFLYGGISCLLIRLCKMRHIQFTCIQKQPAVVNILIVMQMYRIHHSLLSISMFYLHLVFLIETPAIAFAYDYTKKTLYV